MKTECTAGQLEFHGLERRVVVGQFNGGRISSDSGGKRIKIKHLLLLLYSRLLRGPFSITRHDRVWPVQGL